MTGNSNRFSLSTHRGGMGRDVGGGVPTGGDIYTYG